MNGVALPTTERQRAADANDASALNASAFRVILNALARPGAPMTILPSAAAAPAPMSPACATVLATLVDPDARVWLAPSRRTDEIERSLRFATSAAPAASASSAAFLCGRWEELADADPSLGTPEYPDRSATLLVEVDGFAQIDALTQVDGSAASAATARLSGPGLAAPTFLSVDGVGPTFWRYAELNAARYPCGVDFILCAGDRLVGLPRSTRTQVEQ